MLVTLATCCRDRAEHLKQTLPKNIEDNPQPYVRFLLVNYNSQDDMDEWVRSELMRYIPSGRLLYIHEKTADRFKHAHARNVAVRACQTEVFCNVDADNFTGPGFAKWLREFYLANVDQVVFTAYGGRTRGSPCGDMFGRISFLTKQLVALGGYNEDLNMWGVEDYDIIQRAIQAGFKQGGYPADFDQKALKHHHASRLSGTKHEKPIDAMNDMMAAQQGKFGLEQQPNAKGQWGKARVTVNWDHESDLPLDANQVI